ncbi:MAG: hypothetical protein ABF968_06510, partial [Acetobacter sp.]|uniref:hypothetical protein n=1 Tax=Acetobacter sp. TaxID=440 RepID=UPI0039E79884
MSDTKPSYRLKIDRARQHVVEITQKLNEFLNLKPYSVYIDDTDNSMRRWRVKIKHHIPPEWSPIIGDALHNARSALDLLATAIALKNAPSRRNLSGINFIITRNIQEFEDAAKKSNWLRREDIETLKKLEPYKSGNTNLWRLHRLDIVDKHRSLIPIGGACTRFNFPFEIFDCNIIRSESFSSFDGVMRTFPLPPKMIPVSLGPDKRVFP